ncbi:MAG: glycosyl hydrolase family 39 [Acidobacteria bacterium]|nr:glycosyl hydrolase family 39 [Acidobacteriota bacterium]
MILRGSKMHDGTFKALKELGADYVRYVPWLPYPRQAVAELDEPKDGKTSWDFQYIDPTLEDFMKATEGHSVCINFSTIPAWMWKTKTPVVYPQDPNQVFWKYTQGSEMRDPTYKEAADYFARLLSWYEKGGFTDEYGKWHESGHHYKFAYWEVLNEIDLEHHWKPEEYTKFYDAVVTEMHKVDPDLKFMAISLAHPSSNPEMFEYFLNPANHKPGIPIDFITYHFYANHTPHEGINEWQYSFFNQAAGFLNTVRYVEAIRKRLNPSVRTDLNELGVILREDTYENAHDGSNGKPRYVGNPEPEGYFPLAGAMYAHLFIELSRMGIDVIGESQLVGYPSQFPSVTMIDHTNSKPNARYWVLKLLHDNFKMGDKLFSTSGTGSDISAQGYITTEGTKKLLLVNRRGFAQEAKVPADFANGNVSYVAISTGDNAPASEKLQGTTIHLQPFETAVITVK